ncbi:MAG: hypothetical protein MI810_14180 [Flavobacteriales bacterium]|nr:hypothetical protein [Flavobacteriales bacterium]
MKPFYSHLAFPLLLISFFTFSCKKGEITYDFEGKVTETAAGGNVSGADIEIHQVVFSQSVSNTNFQKAGETTTDANGFYNISIAREKVTDFKIDITKDGYFDQQLEFTSKEVSTEESNVFNVSMDAEAWVRLDVKNVGPMPGDELTMVLSEFREGCVGCATNGHHSLVEDIDTTFLFKTTAGRYAYFSFKDEVWNNLTKDSLFTIASDTVFYEFNY